MTMKKIRLTESELTRLVRRIVEDTERMDDIEIDNIDMDDDMSKQEAIRKIAEFLKDEVLSDLSSREINTLERKVEKSENNVSENIYEDDEDLFVQHLVKHFEDSWWSWNGSDRCGTIFR